MCYKYNVPPMGDKRIVQAVLDALRTRGIPVKTGEVGPGDQAAVVAMNRRLEPTAFAMRWGYRLSNGKLVFNTRSETAEEKPLFSDGMTRRRCLVPAECYYEWEQRPEGKQKYAIAPREAEGFYLGGIYRLEGSSPVFSVLTREPVEEIAFIHDRMPVIIPEELKADWLNPRYRGVELLRELRPEMVFRAC